MKDETVLLIKTLGDNKEAVALNTEVMKTWAKEEKEAKSELSGVLDKIADGNEELAKIHEKHLSSIADSFVKVNEILKPVSNNLKSLNIIGWTVGGMVGGAAIIASLIQIFKVLQ